MAKEQDYKVSSLLNGATGGFPRIENPLFFISKSLLSRFACAKGGEIRPVHTLGTQWRIGRERLAAGRNVAEKKNGHDFSENEGSQQEQKDRKGAGTTGRLTHTDFWLVELVGDSRDPFHNA